MKKAIIYVRVSTDEQSEKGYSLQHQEDILRKYCQHQNIEIAGFYKEDHSAKTFDRPAFNELLAFLKKKRVGVDLILFLKWDRFSRNAGDAYIMINRLNKLGVEPQAIEQPLDLNIPENKIMLAFYLTAPEVENDRRSLNIIAGMRRAKKDGRYVTTAPRGYDNTLNELKKPIIAPGKDAPFIKWLFEEMAQGVYSVKDLWRTARKKGFDICCSNVPYILRNPVYCGKIFVSAYKDEPAILVPGLHESIISEALFYKVQDILDGRKRKVVSKHSAQEEIPLRGFLQCPRCGRKLTGSASTGRSARYFYYHCISPCGERMKAEEINKAFKKELSKIVIKEQYIALFENIMKDFHQKSSKDGNKAVSDLKTDIDKNRQRIANAQQLMVDGELLAADYKEIKNRYEGAIQKQERELTGLSQMGTNLMEQVTAAGDLLRNISQYYSKASLPVKQKLVGSIYIGKLIFDNDECRTQGLNEVVEVIRKLGKDYKRIKEGQASDFGSPSKQVWR